jgi:5-methyltetrahydrofolate--homocysteine methyltransferase
MFEGMTLLGENLNATRKVKVDGKKVVKLDGGKVGFPYKGEDGTTHYLDLTQAIQAEAAQSTGLVGYIATGIVNRDEAFIAAMARAQIAAGADYLDCCVDEISPWQNERLEHMRWLIRTVQKYVKMPLSIDSSDSQAIRAGLEVYDASAGKPILNSVNLEDNRIPIIALARESGAQLIGNASGENRLPENIEQRVANLTKLMELMDGQQIPMASRTLDPLVLPIGTNPEHGIHFLESCRQLRERFGPEFHLSGGFSNVSFGLPRRALLNSAMLWLGREAGCDVAFMDPQQISRFEPDDETFQKAVAALKGEDLYCMEYITHCRGTE